MAMDLDKNMENEELDDIDVVVITDDEGNESFFYEEMVLPVNGKNYAILVSCDEEEEDCECGCGHDHHHEGCDCGCEDEEGNAIIAKIEFNEDGEAEYVAPTDEEFAEAMAAYEKFISEE